MFDPNDPFNHNASLNGQFFIDPYDPLKNDGICPMCGMPLECTEPQGIYCLECAMTIGTVYEDYELNYERRERNYKKLPEKIQPPQKRSPNVKKYETDHQEPMVLRTKKFGGYNKDDVMEKLYAFNDVIIHAESGMPRQQVLDEFKRARAIRLGYSKVGGFEESDVDDYINELEKKISVSSMGEMNKSDYRSVNRLNVRSFSSTPSRNVLIIRTVKVGGGYDRDDVIAKIDALNNVIFHTKCGVPRQKILVELRKAKDMEIRRGDLLERGFVESDVDDYINELEQKVMTELNNPVNKIMKEAFSDRIQNKTVRESNHENDIQKQDTSPYMDDDWKVGIYVVLGIVAFVAVCFIAKAWGLYV